jgi:hypothetical protein
MAEEKNRNGKKDEPNQQFDNFQQLLKQVLSVPKEKIEEKRAEYKREKEQSGRGKVRANVC